MQQRFLSNSYYTASKERVIGKWRAAEGVEGSGRQLPRGAEENNEKHASIAGLQAKICTQDLPNTKQEC
jgi:hypothetical protein